MRRPVAIFTFLFLMGCAEKTLPVEPAPPPESAIEPIVEIVAEEAVVEEPPKPRFIIENMLNLAPETVRNILGEAALERAEKDVRVWMYRNSQCVLHLYFYPDDNGDFRLDYVGAEGADQTAVNPTVSPNACLESHVISIEGQQPSSPQRHRDPQPDRSDN